MGMWPSLYPGYQRVDDPAARAKFAAAWGVPEERLSLKPGWKLTDLPHAVEEGKIRAFYNFGEDPLQTEPDTAQMRRTLESLDLLISQDIFMTQTTALADVVLPATSWAEHDAVYTASDRSFQLTTAALPPKGECRHDWEIFADLSCRMGYPMHYESTREIWDEVRSALPAVRRGHLREDGGHGLRAVAHPRRGGRRPRQPRHARALRRRRVHHARRQGAPGGGALACLPPRSPTTPSRSCCARCARWGTTRAAR